MAAQAAEQKLEEANDGQGAPGTWTASWDIGVAKRHLRSNGKAFHVGRIFIINVLKHAEDVSRQVYKARAVFDGQTIQVSRYFYGYQANTPATMEVTAPRFVLGVDDRLTTEVADAQEVHSECFLRTLTRRTLSHSSC
jgi:hypothetical protein